MSSLEHNFDSAGDIATPVQSQEERLNVGEGAQIRTRDRWAAMRIARKLNLAVFGNTIVLAAVALIILGGTWHLAQSGREQIVMSTVEVRSNNAALELIGAVERLDALGDGRGDAVGENNIAAVQLALSDAQRHLDESIELSVGEMPADIQVVVTGFRDRIVGLRTQLDAGPTTTDNVAAIRKETAELKAEISVFALNFRDRVSAGAIALFENITNFLVVFVVLVAIGIAMSVLGARRIVSDIAGMVVSITGSMQRIAQGDTGTAIPGRDRPDEIGEMARSLEVFRKSALELSTIEQARAKDAEERLAQQETIANRMREVRTEKSKLLENMADGFEVSVGELITAVSAASEQLKATSKQMVDLADGSNEQAESATAAMESATANVTAAAAATDEFALSIGEISRQASASAGLARDATKLVTTANTRMTDLSQAADEIGEIAGLIQSIAQRTNLLALNASIEAARGGEAGRGFAVVASEVKELAMQTSNATSSVAEKINAMQESTKSSAGDLTSIVEQIGELEQAAVMIASAVDQQSVSGEELARNIDTVANGSAQVGERLQALRAASEETGNAADDVVASARTLGDHADNLRDKAGRFIADVRRSAKDLETGEAA